MDMLTSYLSKENNKQETRDKEKKEDGTKPKMNQALYRHYYYLFPPNCILVAKQT